MAEPNQSPDLLSSPQLRTPAPVAHEPADVTLARKQQEQLMAKREEQRKEIDQQIERQKMLQGGTEKQIKEWNRQLEEMSGFGLTSMFSGLIGTKDALRKQIEAEKKLSAAQSKRLEELTKQKAELEKQFKAFDQKAAEASSYDDFRKIVAVQQLSSMSRTMDERLKNYKALVVDEDYKKAQKEFSEELDAVQRRAERWRIGIYGVATAVFCTAAAFAVIPLMMGTMAIAGTTTLAGLLAPLGLTGVAAWGASVVAATVIVGGGVTAVATAMHGAIQAQEAFVYNTKSGEQAWNAFKHNSISDAKTIFVSAGSSAVAAGPIGRLTAGIGKYCGMGQRGIQILGGRLAGTAESHISSEFNEFKMKGGFRFLNRLGFDIDDRDKMFERDFAKFSKESPHIFANITAEQKEALRQEYFKEVGLHDDQLRFQKYAGDATAFIAGGGAAKDQIAKATLKTFTGKALVFTRGICRNVAIGTASKVTVQVVNFGHERGLPQGSGWMPISWSDISNIAQDEMLNTFVSSASSAGFARAHQKPMNFSSRKQDIRVPTATASNTPAPSTPRPSLAREARNDVVGMAKQAVAAVPQAPKDFARGMIKDPGTDRVYGIAEVQPDGSLKLTSDKFTFAKKRGGLLGFVLGDGPDDGLKSVRSSRSWRSKDKNLAIVEMSRADLDAAVVKAGHVPVGAKGKGITLPQNLSPDTLDTADMRVAAIPARRPLTRLMNGVSDLWGNMLSGRSAPSPVSSVHAAPGTPPPPAAPLRAPSPFRSWLADRSGGIRSFLTGNDAHLPVYIVNQNGEPHACIGIKPLAGLPSGTVVQKTTLGDYRHAMADAKAVGTPALSRRALTPLGKVKGTGASVQIAEDVAPRAELPTGNPAALARAEKAAAKEASQKYYALASKSADGTTFTVLGEVHQATPRLDGLLKWVPWLGDSKTFRQVVGFIGGKGTPPDIKARYVASTETDLHVVKLTREQLEQHTAGNVTLQTAHGGALHGVGANNKHATITLPVAGTSARQRSTQWGNRLHNLRGWAGGIATNKLYAGLGIAHPVDDPHSPSYEATLPDGRRMYTTNTGMFKHLPPNTRIKESTRGQVENHYAKQGEKPPRYSNEPQDIRLVGRPGRGSPETPGVAWDQPITAPMKFATIPMGTRAGKARAQTNAPTSTAARYGKIADLQALADANDAQLTAAKQKLHPDALTKLADLKSKLPVDSDGLIDTDQVRDTWAKLPIDDDSKIHCPSFQTTAELQRTAQSLDSSVAALQNAGSRGRNVPADRVAAMQQRSALLKKLADQRIETALLAAAHASQSVPAVPIPTLGATAGPVPTPSMPRRPTT